MILIPRKSVALTRSFSSQYSDRVFFACCYSTFSLGGGGGFEIWGMVAPKAISGLNVWIWLSGNRFGSKQWRFVLLNEKSRSKIVRLFPMIPLNQYLLVFIFRLTIKKIKTLPIPRSSKESESSPMCIISGVPLTNLIFWPVRLQCFTKSSNGVRVSRHWNGPDLCARQK